MSSELHKSKWTVSLVIRFVHRPIWSHLVPSGQTLTAAVHKSDVISIALDIVSCSRRLPVPVFIPLEEMRFKKCGGFRLHVAIIRNHQEGRGLFSVFEVSITDCRRCPPPLPPVCDDMQICTACTLAYYYCNINNNNGRW